MMKYFTYEVGGKQTPKLIKHEPVFILQCQCDIIDLQAYFVVTKVEFDYYKITQ